MSVSLVTAPPVEQMSFNYDQLDHAVAIKVRAAEQRIAVHMDSFIEHAVAVGRELLDVQAELPHGAFGPWIDASFPLSSKTAYRWMNAARAALDGKFVTVTNLRGPGVALIEELLSPKTPNEVREEVEKMLADGEVVTKAIVDALIRDKKAAESAAEVLTARNADLAKKLLEKPEPEVVRDETEIAVLNGRINELVEANRLANARIAGFEAPAAHANDTNVVRPQFGAEQEGDEDDDDDRYVRDESAAMDAFAGAIGSMGGLRFSAEAFWKKKGRNGTHGKAIRRALLDVNATIGVLLTEYEK